MRGVRLPPQKKTADLVAMVEAVVTGPFVLVAHSMGGLVARRAAESLRPQLRGLLLLDPTPESAPVYDTRPDRQERRPCDERDAGPGPVALAGPHGQREHPPRLPGGDLRGHAR
ncbi:alpha/beta fold hydrolase [Streptomyces lydicus]|uniref:alpha/beta fold hydrolase n=1 Tax=Streptomyces lydicus TaxID=47763 RepID=UPI00378C48BE